MTIPPWHIDAVGGRLHHQSRTAVDFDFRAQLDEFDFISQFTPWSVTSVQATGWTQERVFGSTTFQMVVSGSGIGPVGSLEAFEDAVDAGFAQGQFNRVSLLRNGQEILRLDLGTTGYTLTSGNQSLRLDGATVNSLAQLYELSDLFTQADVDNLSLLSPAQRQAIFNELAGFGVTGLTFRDGADVIFGLSVGTTAVEVTVAGYVLRLVGSFPDDFGQLAELSFAAHQAFVTQGLPEALTLLTEIAPSAVEFRAPGGALLFTANISDIANTEDTVFIVDGVTVQNDRFFIEILEDGTYVFLGVAPHAPIDDDRATFVLASNGDDTIVGGAGNDTIFGLDGSDVIYGGAGDDYINPGSAPYPRGDDIYGSAGNDTIDFSGLVAGGGWISLTYDDLNAGITVNVNQLTNTGTVVKAGLGTDTLINVAGATSLDFTDGLDIWGTDAADGYTIVAAANSWMAAHGGRGADSYDLTLNEGGSIRLDFAFGWHSRATQGAVVNATTGVIANDGFGFAETLALIRNGDVNASTLQIQGTNNSDRLTGSAGRDQFLPLGGNDTIDGGDGFDMIRFNRSQITTGVTVDLAAGTATGLWQGTAFNHSLTSIEEVLGSAQGDTIRGSTVAEKLDGYAGDDVLVTGGGNDTLIGGTGADRFVLTGAGNVVISDFGVGVDVLDLRQMPLDAAAISAAFANATEGGGGTTVNLGAAGSLILNGLTKAQALQAATLAPLPNTPVKVELFGGEDFIDFAFFNTLSRPLKKSVARNGFLLWQPAVFGLGSLGADRMRA